MTGRKWIAAALSAALLAGLTACGGGAPVNQTPEEAEAPAISETEEPETTETGLFWIGSPSSIRRLSPRCWDYLKKWSSSLKAFSQNNTNV